MKKGYKKFIIIEGLILVLIITLIISQCYLTNRKLNNEIKNTIDKNENNVINKNTIDEKIQGSMI